MPHVSVILPVYNRASSVERCVRSVLSQSFADFELIAVDDASTDQSVRAIESIRDPRLRLMRHERNAGPSAARNTAIRSAKGRFLALIDSDDEWLPEKLTAQLALITESGGNLCGCEYFALENGATRRWELPVAVSWREELHTRCELANGTTLVVRRECAEEVGLLDESLRLYEDWDWVLRLVQRSQLRIVHQPLARVRVGTHRPAKLFAESARRFLVKHATEFQRLGRKHWRRVRAKHFEYVAANAFLNREYGLASTYLVKSFLANPWQNPLRLAALLLAPIDVLAGTSLVGRAMKLQRRLVVR
jgi:glycosyltransferase involved in cell wall biosynthesis